MLVGVEERAHRYGALYKTVELTRQIVNLAVNPSPSMSFANISPSIHNLFGNLPFFGDQDVRVFRDRNDRNSVRLDLVFHIGQTGHEFERLNQRDVC